MTQPHTIDRKGLIEFLKYCIKNDKIDVWNKWRNENLKIKIDLSNINLSGINLSGIYLFRTDLSETNLSGANLSGADLRWAILRSSNLSGADLSGADLSGADLEKAILFNADLSGAIISKGVLNRNNLNGVVFGEGYIKNTKNYKSNIEKETELALELEKANNKLDELESASKEEKTKAYEEIELLKLEIRRNEKAEERKAEALEYITYTPSIHLENIKLTINDRIKYFNFTGIVAIILSGFMFIIGLFLLLSNKIDLPSNTFEYLIYVFTVLFPMVVAFMAYRQSNIKYKDLEAINERILNAANLEGSLQAINSLSPSDKADENMLKIIEKFAERSMGLTLKQNDKDEDKEEIATLTKIVENLVKQGSK